MIGHTEVIYYIPRYFSPSKIRYFFLIHGAGNRHRPGALAHIDEWRHIADIENLVLIAPVFDRIYEPPIAGKTVKDEFLWDFIYMLNRKNRHRSDERLLEIFAYFRKHLARRDRFIIYGHSGGGQFVSRFITFYPELIERAAISASGSFLFPRMDVKYPFGLNMKHLASDFTSQVQADDLKLSKRQFDAKLNALLPLDVFVIAGEKDDTALHDGADWQGNSVAERARSFVDAMKRVGGQLNQGRQAPAPFRFQLVLLPEMGHDHEAGAAAAQRCLFPITSRTRGLVLHLDFDRTLVDKSSHKNRITSDASPSIGDGFAAFSRKGRRHINAALNQASDLLGCTELTIRVRVRMKAGSRSHPYARLIQSSPNQWEGSCLMVNEKGQIVAWIQTTSPVRTPNMFNKIPIKGRSPEVVSNVALKDGEWHDVILIYTGEAVELHVDGRLQGQTNWSGGLINFDRINIGYVRSNGFHYGGDMDDIRVHGQSLAPE